jgi:hypothetical protein
MGLPRSYSAHELTQLLSVDLPVREIHLEGIPQLDDLEFCKPCLLEQNTDPTSEAESKEKHGGMGPYAGVTLTSPYVHSRVDSNTFTIGNPMPESSTITLCQSRPEPYARVVDHNPMPESTLTLCQSRP